jgi:alpha-1,2-mannosyltransferase
VLSIAVSSILAWPFAAVLGVPIAYDIIIRQKRFLFFIIWSLICFLIIAVPVAYIDSHYYGKFVLSWLNIIAYNVFGGGGPDLYGTELWSFYFINGFLNFNVVFLLALVSWPLIELKGRLQPQSNTGNNVVLLWRFIVLPMVIWMGVFFTRPHKEERFLFPIYPLICLSGAISVSLLQDLLMGVVSHVKLGRGILKLLPALVVLAHGVLGLSRTLALHYNYQAPLQVYTVINSQPVLSFTGYMKEINVCVGKEWHRFPSNYFIPDRIIQPFRGRWHMKFIKSEFKGQLPKPYASGPRATSIIPTHMNDMNKEEPTRYVRASITIVAVFRNYIVV